MTLRESSFEDFLNTAMSWPSGLELNISTNNGPLKRGFHIASLAERHENTVDCSGNTFTSRSTVVQLLDGFGGPNMGVETFQKILKQGQHALPGVRTGRIAFEFGHLNDHLQRYRLGKIAMEDGMVHIHLEPEMGFCAPMAQADPHHPG